MTSTTEVTALARINTITGIRIQPTVDEVLSSESPTSVTLVLNLLASNTSSILSATSFVYWHVLSMTFNLYEFSVLKLSQNAHS